MLGMWLATRARNSRTSSVSLPAAGPVGTYAQIHTATVLKEDRNNSLLREESFFELNGRLFVPTATPYGLRPTALLIGLAEVALKGLALGDGTLEQIGEHVKFVEQGLRCNRPALSPWLQPASIGGTLSVAQR